MSAEVIWTKLNIPANRRDDYERMGWVISDKIRTVDTLVATWRGVGDPPMPPGEDPP